MVNTFGPRPSMVDPFVRDRSRLADYAFFRAFAEGDQWTERQRRGTERLTLNYARILVRKTISYVFSGPVGFEVPPAARADAPGSAAVSAGDVVEGADLVRPKAAAATERANAVEVMLAEVLDELDAPAVDFGLAMDSAILGDGVVKVTWDATLGRPRLTAVDPATLLAWWRPDVPNEAYRFQQHYALPGASLIAEGYVPSGSALDGDKLYPVVEDWTAATWEMTVAGQSVRRMANPYGWLPYLVLANNRTAARFWGESDLVDLVDVCRQLNKRVSVLADILNLSGYPIAVLENVDGSEGISVGPGAKWELPEDSKAYLLDLLSGSGVGLHIEYLSELRTTLHDLAETPRTAFGEAGRAVSGAALETELQPLVQRVRRKRGALEALYRRRNAMLLDLMERFGGFDVGGLRRTTVMWPPVLPNDREVEARIGSQLISAGVKARRTIGAEMGVEDPDAELDRLVEEARRLADAVSVDTMQGGGGGGDGGHGVAVGGRHDTGGDQQGGVTQRDQGEVAAGN